MVNEKYNLLKESFYISASAKNIMVSEEIEDKFIQSAKEIAYIDFDDYQVTFSNHNQDILYKLFNSLINFEVTISVSDKFFEDSIVKFCYDIGNTHSNLINEMKLNMLVTMTNNVIKTELNEKDSNEI